MTTYHVQISPPPPPSPDLAIPAVRVAEAAPVSDTTRVVRLLARFGRTHRKWFFLALGLLAIEAGSQVFEAYPLAFLIDFLSGKRAGLVDSRHGTIAMLSAAVLVIASLNSLADSLAEVFLARGGRRLGFDLRLALYRHLTQLSMSFHDRRRTGDTLTRVTGDVTAVEEFVVKSVSDLAGSIFVLIGTITFLALHSLPVTVVAILIVPVLAWVSLWFSSRIKSAAKRHRAREGDLASDAQEMLTSIRVIQSFGRAHRQESDFADHSDLAMQAALDEARLEAGFSWVVSVLQAVSTVAVIWVGVFLIDEQELSVGTLLLFVILIQAMFKPTRRIIKEWNSIAKVFASVERIGELLDREPSVTDVPGAVAAPVLSGRLEMRDVSFAYRGPAAGVEDDAVDVLEHIDFVAEPGQMIALVGPSGAGKSTIAQLVARLYDPTAGQVLVDGVDARTYTLSSLRAQISMVLQETILFTGTVAENIAFGTDTVDEEDIRRAAIRANAHEFIEQLPQGYDTVLSERASNLSGGQRQRLSIARAFIRNSPIVVLDEPTTGLDAGSTDLVLNALIELAQGRTTVVITHDLSLTRTADRILVVDGGRIVEDGPHRDLVAAGGLYASLYTRQLAYESLPDGEDDPGPSQAHDGVAPLSLVLHERFPGLAGALDPDRARPILAAMCAPGFHVSSVSVGNVRYEGAAGCTLRYELDVIDEAAGVHIRHTIGARVLVDRAAAHTYYRTRLVPLARRVRALDEVRWLGRVIGHDAASATVYFAHPVHAELDTLVDLAQPAELAQVMTQVARALGVERLIGASRVELVKYARHNRAVVKLVAEPQDGRSGRSIEAYAKVFAKGVEMVDPVTVEAVRAVAASGGIESFEVPRLLRSDARLRLSVLEAMPGRPLVTALVRAMITSPDDREVVALPLAEALRICAGIAATLHRSTVGVPRARPWTADRDADQRDLDELRPLDAALAHRFARHMDAIEALANGQPADDLVLCHGDYTPSQVLFHDGGVVLLDFDTLCLADAALDVGRFLAYLRMAVRKASAGSDPLESELAAVFLDAYLARNPLVDATFRSRVARYERSSLVRMGLHAWRHLKDVRLQAVLVVLDEIEQGARRP